MAIVAYRDPDILSESFVLRRLDMMTQTILWSPFFPAPRILSQIGVFCEDDLEREALHAEPLDWTLLMDACFLRRVLILVFSDNFSPGIAPIKSHLVFLGLVVSWTAATITIGLLTHFEWRCYVLFCLLI